MSEGVQVPGGFFCCMGHALEFAREKAKKAKKRAWRKEKKEGLDRLKTRSDWTREAQMTFNLFIRLRDKGLPCISCQRHHEGQYHAGHYLTVGARPNLRFNEKNVHKQCSCCNNHLSGNLINYRINLIKKIGVGEVETLESSHDPKKYTIEDIKAIKAKYKLKIKEMKE